MDQSGGEGLVLVDRSTGAFKWRTNLKLFVETWQKPLRQANDLHHIKVSQGSPGDKLLVLAKKGPAKDTDIVLDKNQTRVFIMEKKNIAWYKL